VIVLHDQHYQNKQQFHVHEEIVSHNNRNNDIERRSSSSKFCCNGNLSSKCTFRQLMVPSAYQTLIETMQQHLLISSGCNQTQFNNYSITFSNSNHHHHGDSSAATTTTTSTRLQRTTTFERELRKKADVICMRFV
jgi:hypothetical protein